MAQERPSFEREWSIVDRVTSIDGTKETPLDNGWLRVAQIRSLHRRKRAFVVHYRAIVGEERDRSGGERSDRADEDDIERHEAPSRAQRDATDAPTVR